MHYAECVAAAGALVAADAGHAGFWSRPHTGYHPVGGRDRAVDGIPGVRGGVCRRLPAPPPSNRPGLAVIDLARGGGHG